MSNRERIEKLTITGPITLGDLRWLVESSEGLTDDSKVEVQSFREHGPMDYDPDRITVHGLRNKASNTVTPSTRMFDSDLSG